MTKNKKKCYYLIDFENVGICGLEGAENLKLNDHVHLFSTKNAPKMTTSTLATFNSTNLKVHEVPVKNQSVDMHLVTYLGFLIGTDGDSSDYVIVSKDKDYVNIIKYWKKVNNTTINYADNLKLKQATNSNTTKKNTKKENNSTPKMKDNCNSTNNTNANNSNNTITVNDIFDMYSDDVSNNKQNNTNKNSVKRVNPQIIEELNADISRRLRKYGYMDDMIEKVIAILTKYYGRDQFLVRVSMDLRRDLQLNATDYRQIFHDTIMMYIFPNLSKISPKINSKLITEFVYILWSGWDKELYYDLFNVVRKEMKSAGYSNNMIKKVCDMIPMNAEAQEFFFLVLYSILVNVEKGKDIYKIIGKIIASEINMETTIDSPSPIYNIVRDVLGKAKYKGDVIGYVAYYVSIYHAFDNVKNEVYKVIIDMYGQKEGLPIYNCVKTIL